MKHGVSQQNHVHLIEENDRPIVGSTWCSIAGDCVGHRNDYTGRLKSLFQHLDLSKQLQVELSESKEHYHTYELTESSHVCISIVVCTIPKFPGINAL